MVPAYYTLPSVDVGVSLGYPGSAWPSPSGIARRESNSYSKEERKDIMTGLQFNNINQYNKVNQRFNVNHNYNRNFDETIPRQTTDLLQLTVTRA